MKKFLTLAVVALIAMSASAQKGSMYIGTSGISFNGFAVTEIDNDGTAWGYSYTSPFTTGFTTSDAQTVIGIAPEFGYFITDKMALGASLGFTLTNPDGDKNNVTSFGIAPYLRYFLVQSGNFGLYLQGGFQYDMSSYEADGIDNSTHFNVGILPGISYSFSDKFSATASFGWLGYDKWNDTDSDEFGLKLDGSSLKFGLYYNF